jgi:hypothetical protein
MQRSPAKNAENQENSMEQADPVPFIKVLDFALKAAARSGG